MTVLEASAQLYQWFSEKDAFSLNKDYNKLILISENPEADIAAIECSLESLEEMGVIKSKEIDEEKYWVLIKKFSSIEQSVNISAPTALHLHTIVQMYTEVLGLESKYACDPTDIKEVDIKALLSAVEVLAGSK